MKGRSLVKSRSERCGAGLGERGNRGSAKSRGERCGAGVGVKGNRGSAKSHEGDVASEELMQRLILGLLGNPFYSIPPKSTCASPPASLKGIGKILGGKPSKMGEYPFILSLEENGSQFCGASAIGDYWALTAAHCVDVSARESETYELRAGTLTKGINGTVHHVTKVIVHHGYNYRQLDNDIALIQVAEPFSKNKYVKYVRLPDQGEITPVGTKAWVAGWGLTKPERRICWELKEEVENRSQWRSKFTERKMNGPITRQNT
uniref:Peptidase S1 domain-containing protein n=1 Tax=Timema genevievae TaxID=629358 RepID=A0A7R9PLF7_TIMGE|nr:unnamed protein product [Timema genevievae]